SLTSISDAFAYREEIGQHSALIFRFPTDTRTFRYDLKGQKWTERKYYSAPFQTDYPVGAYVYWPRYNHHLVGLNTAAGGFATLDSTSRQDLGGPLVCERTTGWQDFGGQQVKRSRRVRAVVRRGTPEASVTTPGALEMRVQDDGRSWTQWRQISLGTPGQIEQARDLFFGGVMRRRRYGLRFSNTESMSLVGLYDDLEDLEGVAL
ncbi:MAG TPA: hypothetical protein VEA41_01815, partial [Salinarimonas sp.]|nr:hypothetical protein [Salinarimonas sp.]